LLLGNGNGAFQPPLTSVAGTKASFILSMDFNGDGKLDLTVADLGSNNIGILLGQGNGFFEPPLTFAVGKGPAWIGLFDFGHPGAPDLIVANSLSDSLSVLSNLTPPR
jgi:VCBS repeat protein